MADLKISQMVEAETPLVGSEILPVVQSGNNRKVTVDDIREGLVESDITNIAGATLITNIVAISQANYDALVVKDPNTVYVIE